MSFRRYAYVLLASVAQTSLLWSALGAVDGSRFSADGSRTSQLASPRMVELLSDEQMEGLTAQMQNLEEGPLFYGLPTSMKRAATLRPLCTQDNGRIWKRSSGKRYRFGTVGGKPSIACNSAVMRLSLSSTVYVKVYWGWARVAGPFTNRNWGAKLLVQRGVEYVCKRPGPYNRFRIVSRGSVTYPGLRPIAGGAYSETDGSGLPCR